MMWLGKIPTTQKPRVKVHLRYAPALKLDGEQDAWTRTVDVSVDGESFRLSFVSECRPRLSAEYLERVIVHQLRGGIHE